MPDVAYMRLDGSVPAGNRHSIVNRYRHTCNVDGRAERTSHSLIISVKIQLLVVYFILIKMASTSFYTRTSLKFNTLVKYI